MFEPIRGGTRGGQAEFKWTDVSADKDREVRRLFHICSSGTNCQLELSGSQHQCPDREMAEEQGCSLV
jgi:hypothetical protein